MRKTLKTAKSTTPGVPAQPAPETASGRIPGRRPAPARESAATEPQPAEPAAPTQSLDEIRADLADLTVRIDRERQVRCLPGQDFPLDSATGRLIRADIERLRRIDPASVPESETSAYFTELRDVCRRLLTEVCFSDSPARRQSPGRIASKVGRQMMPRERFTCLDGPTDAADDAADAPDPASPAAPSSPTSPESSNDSDSA